MSYLSICQSRLPFAFSQVQGKAENAVQRGGKWEGQSIAFETERRLLLRTSSSAVESFENGSPNAVEQISVRFIIIAKNTLSSISRRWFSSRKMNVFSECLPTKGPLIPLLIAPPCYTRGAWIQLSWIDSLFFHIACRVADQVGRQKAILIKKYRVHKNNIASLVLIKE